MLACWHLYYLHGEHGNIKLCHHSICTVYVQMPDMVYTCAVAIFCSIYHTSYSN